jgi:hypothetical protein|uniref:AAA family ATPase n=1 Tax=Segatella hominis TaxID=2518605 RepID=UPI004029E3FD
MNIRIIIDKLGPITDSEIVFKPFMVFTGESGLGKSYTALLWYNLITSLTPMRLQEFITKKINGSVKEELTFKFKDFRMWLNQNTAAFLGYLLGNNNFDCQVNYVFEIDDDIPVEMKRLHDEDASGFTRYSINGDIDVFPLDLEDNVLMMSFSLHGYLSELCFGKNYLRPLILPPARAAFMGANTTSPIGMYRDFLAQLDDLKTPSRIISPDNQFFVNYIAKLSDGEIVLENGSVFLQFESGEKIPVSAAASSVKELMPFLLMLQNGKIRQYNSLLFEEPEAHVHPKKQFLLMDMLARCCNKGMLIQMTTHSDYLLGRMNQLLVLGKIREKSMEAFEIFCKEHQFNKNLYLHTEQIGGYYFKRENDRVVIEEQDLSLGLPFNSFENTVKSQMELSADINDLAESLGIVSNL